MQESEKTAASDMSQPPHSRPEIDSKECVDPTGRSEREQSLQAIQNAANNLDRSHTDRISRMLERYRNYMTLLARSKIPSEVQQRVDASDVVQETILELHNDFDDFLGSTEQELVAWLRRALLRNILDHIKCQRAARRDVRRELRIEKSTQENGGSILDQLEADISTPSQHVSHAEQSVRLANALNSLPVDYRDVILFRNIDRMGFAEIGKRMNRTHGATRMLWLRALEALKKVLDP